MTEIKKSLKEIFKQIAKRNIDQVKIYENIINLCDTKMADNTLLKLAQDTFKDDMVNTHNFNFEVANSLGIKFEEDPSKEEEDFEEEKDEIEIAKREANKKEKEEKQKIEEEVKKKELEEDKKDLDDEDDDSESISKRLGLD